MSTKNLGQLKGEAAKLCEYIAQADHKAMCADGPVSPTSKMMTQEQLQECLSFIWENFAGSRTHLSNDARATYERELQDMLTDREDCLASMVVFVDNSEDGVETILQTAWHRGNPGEVSQQIIDTCASMLLQVWVLERGLSSFLGEPMIEVHTRAIERYKELVRMVDTPENQAAFTVKFRKD